MKICVNGEIKKIKVGSSSPNLSTVINQLGFHPKLVVVEFNGRILNSERWETQPIKEGDNLEIVTIVGGGS